MVLQMLSDEQLRNSVATENYQFGLIDHIFMPLFFHSPQVPLCPCKIQKPRRLQLYMKYL